MKKVLVFLCALLSACVLPTYDYTHIKVIKVIDGDTVKLADDRLLRYIGIDTPEIRIKKQGKFIYAPQPYALEAKRINQKLVENKFVRVEFDVEKKDAYGRLLGYCFIADTFINAKLIEDGFAVLCTIPPNVKYADLFVKLQGKARESKRGLWGVYETIDHAQAHLYINQIRTVRGKVIKTRKTKHGYFLHFGNDYKNDFTIVIFNDCLAYFYAKGINPLTDYKAKIVEISGRIKSYAGPQIIARTPQDIRIIDEK